MGHALLLPLIVEVSSKRIEGEPKGERERYRKQASAIGTHGLKCILFEDRLVGGELNKKKKNI